MKYLILGAMMALSSYALAQVPPQAQASNLAVPEAATADRPPPADLTSLVIVDECKLAVAVLGVDNKGEVYPLHFSTQDKDEVQKLIVKLARKIQADNVLEVTLPCPDKKLPGLPNT